MRARASYRTVREQGKGCLREEEPFRVLTGSSSKASAWDLWDSGVSSRVAFSLLSVVGLSITLDILRTVPHA